MDKDHKIKFFVIVLILLLFLSLAYILFDKYSEKKQREQLNFFQQGVQKGYEQAVYQLIQQVSTCNQIPVTFGNKTINIINVDCLQE